MKINRVDPMNWAAQRLEDFMTYEYIGLYGEPDPNPEGGLDVATTAVLLSDDQGVIVGMCGIKLEGETAYLMRMFIIWEYRGLGHSKTLLAGAEQAARDLGAERLYLETGTVQTAAIGLYVSQGYAAVEPYGFYAEAEESIFLGKEL